MLRNTIKYCICLFTLAVSLGLSAQPVDNAPLSRFGFGEPVSPIFIAPYSQGGLGSAYWNIHQVNLVNPASLGHLEAASLDLGLYAKRSRIRRGEFSSTVWSGNLEYLSLSFPIINPINELLERRERNFAWGLNISLLPFSRVGYSITSEDSFDSIGVVARRFEGTGGLYRFNVGNGWRYKNIAFGLNVGYVYGNTAYSAETNFEDLVGDYQHISRSDISYRSFVYDLGAQYTVPLSPSKRDNKRMVILGAHYNSGSSFDTKRDDIDYVRNIVFNDSDTAVYVSDQPGEGRFQSEFGIGVYYRESTKWGIGIDFNHQGWDDYYNDARPDTLLNTWRVGIGGMYIPDLASITSFLDRIEYRAGVFYGKDPRMLEGEQAFRYGVTVGAGVPFIFLRSFSYLNIGLEYGRAGTESALKENYFRARVGLVLNDSQWFLKRRYH